MGNKGHNDNKRNCEDDEDTSLSAVSTSCTSDDTLSRISPLERTVLSNVRGISFPLKISINNTESKEQKISSNEYEEDDLKEESFENKLAQSNNLDETEEQIIEEYEPKVNQTQLNNIEVTEEKNVEEGKYTNKFAQFKDAEVGKEEIIEESNSEDKFAQLKNREEINQGNSQNDKLKDKSIELENTVDNKGHNDNKRNCEDDEDTSLSAVSTSCTSDD